MGPLHSLCFLLPTIFCAPSINLPMKEIFDDFLEEETQRILVNVHKKSDNQFEVKVHKEDASPFAILDLHKCHSPFAEDFKLRHMDVGEDGQLMFYDDEPLPGSPSLHEISSFLFADPDNDAILRIKPHHAHDEFTLEGLLNGDRISWNNSEPGIRHYLHSNKRLKRKRQAEQNPENGNSEYEGDSVDEHRPLIYGRAPPGASVTAAPDVIFILDFENSKLFNWDRTKILDYCSIILNAVNNRYLTNTDLQVTFTLAGIVTTKTKDVEKHFEKARRNDAYNSNQLLKVMSYWAFENKDALGKHDLVSVLTAVPFEAMRLGVAYVESACWTEHSPKEKRDMTVSLSRDVGGIWNGAIVVAHELAHSLGAPHDGEATTVACPWSDGYMMSYEGWGTVNKYRFSKCSQKSMREFITSSGGTCLKHELGQKNLLSSTDPLGKRMSMEELCKKSTGKEDAVVTDDDPDTACRMLKCRYSTGNNNMFAIQTIPTLIGDDAPCGKGGKCKDGSCVGNQQKPITEQSEKDEICKEEMNDKGATSMDTSEFSGDQQCSSLKCKFKKPEGRSAWLQVFVFLGNGVPCNKVGKCEAGKCSAPFG